MAQKEKRQASKRGLGFYIRTIIFVIALCVFLWSAAELFSIWREYKVGEDEYHKLAEEFVHTVVPTEPVTTEPMTESESSETEETTVPDEMSTALPTQAEPAPFSVDFDALKAMNPDNIGWLIMEGTLINNPVVQGTDNVHYLRYTYQNVWNIAGCLFMDYRNSEQFASRHSIIYGHNQKNEMMFGTLQNYSNPAFFQAHPTFSMYTPDGVLKYQIFAAYRTGASSDSFQIQFHGDEAFADFINRICSRSLYQTGVSVTVQDHILTLATCTDDTVDRFVVHAKLIS